MYYYEVGYGSYEDSGRIMLSHETLYDDAAFRQMCIDVSKLAMDKYQQKFQDDDITRISFDELYTFVAEALIEQYGFQQVIPSAGFFPFGWSNILDQDDWKTHRDEDLEAMRLKIQGKEQ